MQDPLVTLPNCLIVSHIASASVATRTKIVVMAAENFRAVLAGKPLPHCVNPEVFQIIELNHCSPGVVSYKIYEFCF